MDECAEIFMDMHRYAIINQDQPHKILSTTTDTLHLKKCKTNFFWVGLLSVGIYVKFQGCKFFHSFLCLPPLH